MERCNSRKAQSLVEVLVGVGLAAIFIAGGVGLIAPALQSNKQVLIVQTKTELSTELLNNIRGWASGNWNKVVSLSTSSANRYYLVTTTSPFIIASGSEVLSVGSTSYVRSFYLVDVYRDMNGNVTTTVTSNAYDPSTKEVFVSVNTATSTIATTTFALYITRSANNVLSQSSWAGGSGQNTPVTVIGSSYSSANSITVNASGSIQLSAPTGGSCAT